MSAPNRMPSAVPGRVFPSSLMPALVAFMVAPAWPAIARGDETDGGDAAAAAPDETNRLSVGEILRRALDRSPMLAAAGARVDMARAMPDQASAYPVPSFGVTAMGIPTSAMDPWEIWYTARQMIPLSSARSRRADAAWAGVDAERANADAAVLDLVLEIRLAYVELGRALAEASVIDEQTRTIHRMARIADEAYASGSGMGTQADSLRARAELPMLDDEQRMAGAMAESGRAMIGAAAGLEDDEAVLDPAVIDPDAFQAPTLPSLDDLLAQALERRPEFASIEAQARQAESTALAAADEVWPDLMIEAGVQQRIGGDMSPVGFMLGVEATIPWVSPGSYRGMEAEAEAQARMVRSDADALRLSIESDLRGLLARYDQIVAGIASYRETIGRLHEAERSAHAAYVSGAGAFDAILGLESRMLEARRSLVRYLYDTHAVRARIDRVTARPVEEQILEAEVWP